ncbi:MAG: PE PGRS family protein, partial [Mycobacterium sp.]
SIGNTGGGQGTQGAGGGQGGSGGTGGAAGGAGGHQGAGGQGGTGGVGGTGGTGGSNTSGQGGAGGQGGTGGGGGTGGAGNTGGSGGTGGQGGTGGTGGGSGGNGTAGSSGGPGSVPIGTAGGQGGGGGQGGQGGTGSGGQSPTVTPIPLGFHATGVAVSPQTGDIYVAGYLDSGTNPGLGQVLVYNSANTLITTTPITVGYHPEAVAVSPQTGEIYVTNQQGNGDLMGGTVSVISPANATINPNAVIHTIHVGTYGPNGVAVSPVTGDIYVANSGNGSVYVISPSDNLLTPPISTGANSEPWGVAVSPTTGDVYVTDVVGTVHVYNSANMPLPNLNVSQGGSPEVAVSPTTGDVYVTNTGGSTVSVFDSTNAPLNPISIDQGPQGVAVAPIGTTHPGDVYVSYNDALHGNGPAVAVIDPAGPTTISLPSVSGQAPGTVAVSPITGDVYVTNFTDETLSVIS